MLEMSFCLLKTRYSVSEVDSCANTTLRLITSGASAALYPYHADFKLCPLKSQKSTSVIESHDDGRQAQPPSVLSMSSSRSRNRSSTSPEPASPPDLSPLSLSKSRDCSPTSYSYNHTHP